MRQFRKSIIRSSMRIFLGLTMLCLVRSGIHVANAGTGPEVKLTTSPDRVRVEMGGSLFTEYIFTGASRPYLYPLLLGDGTQLSRDFPMQETPGEDQDHPWHRSLWFAHSFVNGVDFWNEGKGDIGRSPKDKGSTVHDALLEATSGQVGVIRTRNRWVAPDSRLICTDERTIRFHGASQVRIIDYEITLHAPPEKPLLLGDNKDGTMAMRVAQWMTLPHRYQGRDLPGNGHILTSTGKRDEAAWGTRADWCDYYAPHEGRTYGVAIFDHPQNLRHPTWWMARPYGLFAANPFGQHDFERLEDQPHIGDYTIEPGASLTLRYRFVFHLGDAEAAHLNRLYREYAAEAVKEPDSEQTTEETISP